jgi:hypothetical protein
MTYNPRADEGGDSILISKASVKIIDWLKQMRTFVDILKEISEKKEKKRSSLEKEKMITYPEQIQLRMDGLDQTIGVCNKIGARELASDWEKLKREWNTTRNLGSVLPLVYSLLDAAETLGRSIHDPRIHQGPPRTTMRSELIIKRSAAVPKMKELFPLLTTHFERFLNTNNDKDSTNEAKNINRQVRALKDAGLVATLKRFKDTPGQFIAAKLDEFLKICAPKGGDGNTQKIWDKKEATSALKIIQILTPILDDLLIAPDLKD